MAGNKKVIAWEIDDGTPLTAGVYWFCPTCGGRRYSRVKHGEYDLQLTCSIHGIELAKFRKFRFYKTALKGEV